MSFQRNTTPYLAVTHTKIVVTLTGTWQAMANLQARLGCNFYLEGADMGLDFAFCTALAEAHKFHLTWEPADEKIPFQAVFTKPAEQVLATQAHQSERWS